MFKCTFVEDGYRVSDIDGDGPATLRRVTETLDNCPAAKTRQKPAFDPAFYEHKAALRDAFPGTMVEIVPAGAFLSQITLIRGAERTAIYAMVNRGP